MDEDDLFEYYRVMTNEKKAKRAQNRELSAQLLTNQKIEFTSHNSGAHLVVTPANGIVFDFWPGTGKYKRRGDAKFKRGVFHLIDDIQRLQKK